MRLWEEPTCLNVVHAQNCQKKLRRGKVAVKRGNKMCTYTVSFYGGNIFSCHYIRM